MYCTQCGYKNPDDAKFCRECGSSLAINCEQEAVSKISEKNTKDTEMATLKVDAHEQDENVEEKTKKKFTLLEKIVIAVIIITFPFWGSLETSKLFNLRSSQKIEDPKPQVTPAPNTIYVDEYIIEITDAFIENDYLVTSYNFTNASSSEAAFYLSVNNRCWQNGVEISEVYYPRYDVNNDMSSLLPGATITIYKVYDVSNTKDEVTLTFEPLINFTSEQSSISIDLSQLDDYSDGNSSVESESKQLCAGDFLGLTIPEIYELTDKAWVLSPDYYNGGRYLTHDKYHYILLFDGGDTPTFTETITCVMSNVYDVEAVNGIYVGQTVSEIMSANPNFEIEYSELYDPCISGVVNYSGKEYVVIMRFDEYNKTYRAEVW